MWNPSQYLKFDEERTQPCRDLIHRISLNDVRRVIDLGCGPGNSTQMLADRWPDADISGLDNSQEMIAAARLNRPQIRWVFGDISTWNADGRDRPDLVFSNAALHWVPDHRVVYPRLLDSTAGALAVQIPANFDGPAHCLMQEMATSTYWRSAFRQLPQFYSHTPAFYYDLLWPLASRLDIWQTEYIHILPGADSVVEWFKGTGMRPYLNALNSDEDRAQFTAEYTMGIRERFQPQSDGRVLLPFRRTFLIVYPKIISRIRKST